jgi:hypothetical protein
MQQQLECAPVAFAGELRLEHVEAKLFGFSAIAFAGNEFEGRIVVDEVTQATVAVAKSFLARLLDSVGRTEVRERANFSG